MNHVEPLDTHHKRLAFTSGNEVLDRYLHEIAYQAKRKSLAAIFVAVGEDDPATILGYYTLSTYTIEGLDIPAVLRTTRKLPSHRVGATLLGRLAVAMHVRHKGIGELLLIDALKQAHEASRTVASTCVVVDAIDEAIILYYERFGFVRVAPDSRRLVLMMETIAQLFSHGVHTTAATSHERRDRLRGKPRAASW